MSEPLISVIVCVKNGMPYLPEALESLPAQTYKNFEVIVQDGGSDDGIVVLLSDVESVLSIWSPSLA